MVANISKSFCTIQMTQGSTHISEQTQRRYDSLQAQVICPTFMAVMWNPWCLQYCHYLNNLACALRTLFGFLDRNGKRSLI